MTGPSSPWPSARRLPGPETDGGAADDHRRRHRRGAPALQQPIQVLEIIGIVAGFNAMNRWTGPLRLTQQDFRALPDANLAARTRRASPRSGRCPPGTTGTRCMPAAASAPAAGIAVRGRSKVGRVPRAQAAVRACGRIGHEGDAARRARSRPHQPVPNWVRLLLNFPKAGPAKVADLMASQTKGDLSPRLNAQLAWVSARADRAWYALAHRARPAPCPGPRRRRHLRDRPGK